MNIVLFGMMAAGKTTVGERLALAMRRPFVDTDRLIVERYGEITEIFQTRGEGYFRVLEGEIVKELVQKDGQVIAVGGGLVLSEENVSLLKRNGKMVYLRGTVETLVGRLTGDKTRPLLRADDLSLRGQVEKLLLARAPIYERVADFTVDIDGKTPENIAVEIMSKLQGNN